MKLITTLVVFFLFITSCHKEEDTHIQRDENGVIITLPYQWKKSLHLDGIVSNSTIRKAIYYKGNIAIPTTNGNNNRLMTLINSNNGDYIWSWDDRYQPETEDIFITHYHQHNNLLTYQKGDRSYCINLDNGATQWKFRRDDSFHVNVSGLDNVFFIKGESSSMYPNYQEDVVFKGNLETGELNEFIIPNFTINNIAPGNRIGDVTRIESYMHNGVQHLVVTWQEPQNVNSINDWQTYLGLYNYETNEWVYEKKVMNQPNINGVVLAPPVIYQGKFYANIGHQLVCHDIATGNQVWIRDFPQDFMFSGFIIEDNKIIANNEDTYTYCLNPENGNIIWKTESSGTSGRMSYLNGIVYFVGGSTGKLHAIDVSTGDHVWKISAGNLGESSTNNFKTNAVYMFEAENGNPAKVIALSHLNAYCFEAYQ
ncbi:MAG: PQQ-binding-like beta-propeller repeat protein [Flavobacteriaceae bacterium]